MSLLRRPCILSGAAVEKTFVLPQLHLVEKLVRFSAVAVHHGRRHSLRGADADPHGPCDHGESPVACGQGGRCPCYAGRAVHVFFYGSLYLAVTCTVFGVRRWSTSYGIFWKISSDCFPYATLLGSTADTCFASVYEAFWKNFARLGPSFFSALLGSTADSCSCVRLWRLSCGSDIGSGMC